MTKLPGGILYKSRYSPDGGGTSLIQDNELKDDEICIRIFLKPETEISRPLIDSHCYQTFEWLGLPHPSILTYYIFSGINGDLINGEWTHGESVMCCIYSLLTRHTDRIFVSLAIFDVLSQAIEQQILNTSTLI